MDDYLRRLVDVPPPGPHGTTVTRYTVIGDMRRPATMEEELRAARAREALARGDDFRLAVDDLGKELRGAIEALGKTLSASSAMTKVAVTIDEAQRLLGCGRGRVFALLKTNKLKRAPRTGRTTLITIASVEALLAAPASRESSPSRSARRARGWKRMNRRNLRV